MSRSDEYHNQQENKRNTIYHRWKYIYRLFKLIASIAPKDMFTILFVTLCIGLVPLLSIFALQQLVNSITLLGGVSSTGLSLDITIWMILLIGALILQSASNIYGRMIRDHIQEKIKANIQKLVINKTHKLELAQFEDATLYDQLQRTNKGLDTRLFSTITFMFQSISACITLISLLIYLAFIHWFIPLILFIGSAIFTVVRVKLFIEKYLLDRKQTTDMRKLTYLEKLMTSRETAREIRLYGLGTHLRGKWRDLNDKMREERIQLAGRESRKELISSGGNTMIFATVLTGIVYLATLGLLSVGQYAAFIRAVIQFQQELSDFFWMIAIIDNDLRYIKDFFEYIDLPEEKVKGTELPTNSLNESIQCDQISFTYPGSSEPALNKIDMSIQPGERIAIVGSNGSGKTTLIKLLLGLYKPTDGKILVGGVDLQQIDLSKWRKKCTAIFQDFHKYHLSVKDNIAVGQIEKIIEYDQVKQAASLSGADDMIQKLSDGYDTFLGKEFGGEELSEGQWQKVAIARAYMRDPDLLILDEPTSSLDPKAEVDIYKQFQQVTQGKTTIFISHRLGICKLADRIIVLNDGCIVEQGTHEQLSEKDGYYAKMYRLQSQWYT